MFDLHFWSRQGQYTNRIENYLLWLCVPADVQEELDTTRLSIQDNEQHIKRIDETLAVDVMASQEIDLKSRRLTQIVQTTEEKLNRMMSKTIAQELQAYLGAEEETKPLDATTMLEREKGSVADKVSSFHS